ncbi:hypothetical protein ACWEP2_38665 [Streptomyces sp. NPDC004279]
MSMKPRAPRTESADWLVLTPGSVLSRANSFSCSSVGELSEICC